jgi:hypothetical protein
LLDWGVRIVLEHTIFGPGDPLRVLLEQIANIVFGLLYVILLWDILKVFIPQLAGSRGVKEAVDDEEDII